MNIILPSDPAAVPHVLLAHFSELEKRITKQDELIADLYDRLNSSNEIQNIALAQLKDALDRLNTNLVAYQTDIAPSLEVVNTAIAGSRIAKKIIAGILLLAALVGACAELASRFRY